MTVLKDQSLVIDDLVDDGLEHDLFDTSGELRVSKNVSLLLRPLARWLTLRVDLVSSIAEGEGFIVAITATRASPAREGWRI